MSFNKLYVPISIHVLLIGNNENSNAFVRQNPEFGNLTYSFIGDGLQQVIFEEDTIKRKGAHIHWKLPDALSSSMMDKDDELVFPNVPDRWIVTRLWKQRDMLNQKIHARSWQIESSALGVKHKNNPLYADSPKVPYLKLDANGVHYKDKYGKPFRRLGRSYEYGASVETAEDEVENLTAVGPGNTLFAEDYRSCENVFGFYDNLIEDEKVLENADITYHIYGWYNNSSHDMLHQVTSKEDCIKKYGWTPQGEIQFPADMVCHGISCNVSWVNQDTDYTDPTLLHISDSYLAIGNNTMEAVAALTNANAPGNAEQEKMLNLLFNGDEPLNKSLKSLQKSEDSVHTQRFGFHYPIQKIQLKPIGDQKTRNFTGVEQDYVDTINQTYLEIFQKKQVLEESQENVYDNWYQIAHNILFDTAPGGDPDDLTAKSKVNNRKCIKQIEPYVSQIPALRQEIAKLESVVESTMELLKDSIKGEYEIVSANEQRFWHPNNPVIMFSHLPEYYMDEDDSNYSSDGTLACRTDVQMITKLTMSYSRGLLPKETTIYADDIFEGDLPACTTELIKEAILLSPCFANTIAWFMLSQNGIEDDDKAKKLGELVKKLQLIPVQTNEKSMIERKAVCKAAGFDGLFPSRIGISYWKQPWHPLYMMWQIRYYIDPEVIKQEPDLKNWTLGDEDFTYTGDEVPDTHPIINEGSIFITPQGAVEASEKIKKYLNNEDLAAEASGLNIVSQALSGFNEQLLMQKLQVQTPVFVCDDWGSDIMNALPVIRNLLDGYISERPVLSHYYSPIRAGKLEITSIGLVNNYGQLQKIEHPKGIAITEDMRFSDQVYDRKVMLPPRIVQPSRLNFRWIRQDKENEPCRTDKEQDSPVCGWLLPNHFEQTLMVFASDGTYLGCLMNSSVDSHSVVWSDVPGHVHNGSLPHNMNTDLYQFLSQIISLGEGESIKSNILTELFQVIDDSTWLTNPNARKQCDGISLYVGKPIVLAKADVQLQLLGNPKKYKTAVDEINPNPSKQVNITKAKFPVRIGRKNNYSDGTIGFFEDGNYQTLYVTDNQTTRSHSYFSTHNQITLQPDKTLAPKKLTFLMDPLGDADLVSGILPVKTASLNLSMVNETIKKLYLTLFSAPVIMDRESIMLPYPDINGQEWVYQMVTEESNITEEEKLHHTNDNAYFMSDGPIVREGWLKLKVSGKK